MKPVRFSLTFAILTSLAALLLLSWLLLSIISFKTAEKDLIAQKSDQGRVLLAGLLAIAPYPAMDALPRDLPAGRVVERFAREKDFLGFLLVDAQLRPMMNLGDRLGVDTKLREVLKTGKEQSVMADNGRTLLRYAPLVYYDRVVGAGRLTLSLTGEHDRLQRSKRLFIAYFVLDFLLLFAVGSYILRRIIVVPVRKLLVATERVTAGDYEHAVYVPGSAEIADLAASFSIMQATLQAKRQEVEAHVKSLEAANRALQEAREEAIRSEKMASVGLLAAGMAHEVGTPLAAIIGYAGILADEVASEPEQADYVKRIGQEAARIDRLVRELLDYARPRSPELELFDCDAVVRDTVEMLERQGGFKKITTEVRSGTALPRLYLDRYQFMQVFINLFINARDAMPQGGRLVVQVTAAADSEEATTETTAGKVMGRRRSDFGGAFRTLPPHAPRAVPAVVISVQDTGGGIAPEHLGRIFDPFFTTKVPGQGTGLGLAISARIVDSFGGRITVQSEVGRGTTFTVWLPAA
jgi:signal transduction histidine kinase